jgi:Tfp pilus assembly protein PilX
MNELGKRTAAEKGSALIFALLAILVLSVLAATVMFTSQSQVWTSLNYRQTAQARYVAEAGVQATINWLGNSTGSTAYPPPTMASSYTGFTVTAYPVLCAATGNGCSSTTAPVMLSSTSGNSNYYDLTGAVANNFAAVASGTVSGITGASYKTTATLLRMPTATTVVSWLSGPAPQTWQITSVGTVQGVTTSTVQVVETFDRITVPVFTNGLETTSPACGSVTFASSGSYTDSYNSNLNNGAYSTTTNSQASGGNVGTNGNVYLGSGVTVNGTITAENTLVATSNQAGVSPNPPCLNAVTNKTGNSTFDQGTYKEPATLVAKLPWGCTAQPCYPPPINSTTPNIITNQNINTQCASITGCSAGTSVNVYDATGSNHPGTTISASVYTLAPGSYGNLTIGNTSTNSQDVTVVHVSAGTYNINSIDMGSSDAQVVVDSGPVVFNMVGNCSSGCPTESGLPSGFASTEIVHISGAGGLNGCKPSGGTGTVANPGSYGNTTCGTAKSAFNGIPSNMQFVYGGTNTVRLGGMSFAAVIYAPAAGYYTPGAPVGLYGSVICSMFNDSSGSPWHYDNALGATGMKVGGYKSLGFSWTKF